jgi:hypothetical protein
MTLKVLKLIVLTTKSWVQRKAICSAQTLMPHRSTTKNENKTEHPHPAPPPSEGEDKGGGWFICVLNKKESHDEEQRCMNRE